MSKDIISPSAPEAATPAPVKNKRKYQYIGPVANEVVIPSTTRAIKVAEITDQEIEALLAVYPGMKQLYEEVK